ncbi:MAG: NADH-quinone oxidoreductase subunit L [Anaerolinea sp.]|nr:NADH-quinone oxidoreductase subunit L [Anaerolinea sp.]
MATILVLLTMLLPWAGALTVLLAGDRRERWQRILGVGFSGAGVVASLALLGFAGSDPVAELAVGGVFGSFAFVPDGLGVFLAAVAQTIGCLSLIFALDYMEGEPQFGRFSALVLVFIGAMCGLVLTESLLLLFVFWEMTALCSYALISFHNDDPKAVAGGIRALVITQIGGIGLLIGILAIYSQTGSLALTTLLAEPLPASTLSLAAFGFLLAAAAKSAQVPFHTWLPGAMEAPTPVSALIHAATMVNAGVYLLARFYPAFAGVPGWTESVIVVGTVTALLGALMALATFDLKRVLAYSTVSQLGFMVAAVGAGGVYASQFHLLNHAVFKALLFLCAGAVIHAVGTRDMRRMGHLRASMPLVRAAFAIGGLALIGIPIFNGFWSKELIMEALVHDAPGAFAVLLFTVGLTALYTLRAFWLVFYGEAHTAFPVHDASGAMRFSLVALAVGAVILWVCAGAFGDLLEHTLPYHGEVLHYEPLTGMIAAVLTDPATYATLFAAAVGVLLWLERHRLNAGLRLIDPLMRAAQVDFGFAWLNRQIVSGVQRAAVLIRRTQTGQVNWNMVGVVSAFVVVLLVLWIGR